MDSAPALQRFLFDRSPRLAGSIPVLSRFLRFAFATNGPTSEEELWEVLDQVVAFIAEERPLVFVLEDLQWADEGTVRLFHFIARRVGLPLPDARRLEHRLQRRRRLVMELASGLQDLPGFAVEAL